MHELQQLDGELDVAQPARAELELRGRPRLAGMWSTTRRRIAWTSATKSGRPAASQTSGAIVSM